MIVGGSIYLRLFGFFRMLKHMKHPFFEQLKDSENILLSGAGGGFDIYSGIPLMMYLLAQGKTVVLGNYSFAVVSASVGRVIGPTGYEITPASRKMDYFPELFLAEWLAQMNLDIPIIGFSKSGVIPLAETYQAVIEEYDIDSIILVDGGTDSLMKGDEAGLGTPVEDMTSIAAVSALKMEQSYLACLGFGIDHFHGVSHYQYLENVSQIIRRGGFLGTHTILKEDTGGKAFLELINYANGRDNQTPSIVANSIADALKGNFGNHHSTHRTSGSELFINPLMSQYWFFTLEAIEREQYYLEMIKNTQEQYETAKIIKQFRSVIQAKKWKDIPL